MAKSDLSNLGLGQVGVDVAENFMRLYNRNRGSKHAEAYLFIAATNLHIAALDGEDTTSHYERLKILQTQE